jgi:hypothetical protein
MNIAFKMLADGGFVAGDRGSRMTSYAYPSSPHAIVAKKHPKAVAEDMLGSERMSYRGIETVQEYDRKNWLLLASS